MEEEDELRKKIKEINNSQDDQKTKNKKIFDLMNQSFKQQKKGEQQQEQKKICNHYERKCNIIAPCCNKEFPCRLCHNENSDHEINRFEIKEIVCRECNILQSASNECINCHIKFANYHCNICISL